MLFSEVCQNVVMSLIPAIRILLNPILSRMLNCGFMSTWGNIEVSDQQVCIRCILVNRLHMHEEKYLCCEFAAEL